MVLVGVAVVVHRGALVHAPPMGADGATCTSALPPLT